MPDRFIASRHPYTYAADFLRVAVQDSTESAYLPSRGECARLRKAIADALGMTDATLAERFSEAYQAANNIVK